MVAFARSVLQLPRGRRERSSDLVHLDDGRHQRLDLASRPYHPGSVTQATHSHVDPPTDHERDAGRDQSEEQTQSGEDQERAAQRSTDDGITDDRDGFPPG